MSSLGLQVPGQASEPAPEAGIGVLAPEPVQPPLELGVDVKEQLQARALPAPQGPSAADDLGVTAARIEEVDHAHHGDAQSLAAAKAGPEDDDVQWIPVIGLKPGDTAIVVGARHRGDEVHTAVTASLHQGPAWGLDEDLGLT